MINDEWFEMTNLKNKKYNNSVWIPLKGMVKIGNGNVNQNGYQEELIFFNSVMIDKKNKDKISEIDWNTLSFRKSKGYVSGDKYISSDIVTDSEENELGIVPVLEQEILRENFKKWYLHQDIILTLGLEKEGDNWVSPEYGYEIVVKEKKDLEGNVILIEIKAEYLKDYLAARNKFLYLLGFFGRLEISEEAILEQEEKTENYLYEKYSVENREQDSCYIQKIVRTDVNIEDDIPDLSKTPNDNNIKVESKTINSSPEVKGYSNFAKLWTSECILPGSYSPKVRGDKVEEYFPFKVDNEGNTLSGEELRASGKWLWFEPEVIQDILSKRGTSLKFFSRYIGELECSYGYKVYFGINTIGKITIYSEDIATLPSWVQKIFLGKNITPEGGLCREQYKVEIECIPPKTTAPEVSIKDLYYNFNKLTEDKFGFPFFKNVTNLDEAFKKISRFKVSKLDDAYSLAKDISKITVDAIDLRNIKKYFDITEDIRSLKSLEQVLAKVIGIESAEAKMKFIFAIYDLRNFDAHPKINQEDINNAFERLEIKIDEIPVIMGEKIISKTCKWLYNLIDIIYNSEL